MFLDNDFFKNIDDFFFFFILCLLFMLKDFALRRCNPLLTGVESRKEKIERNLRNSSQSLRFAFARVSLKTEAFEDLY